MNPNIIASKVKEKKVWVGKEQLEKTKGELSYRKSVIFIQK